MHIVIVEKDVNGRNMLMRMLKMEGYEVSAAESGSQAVKALKEARTNIVLMNVFRCMYASDFAPELKFTAHQVDASRQALLFTCGDDEEYLLDEQARPEPPCCNTEFDRLPAKVKSGIMNRILQMCSALRQSTHRAHPSMDFSWERFSLLMELPTDAYLGCRFVR